MSTHELSVTLVHSSGLTVHRFGKQFTYFSYLKIQSVYPDFGTAAGATLLEISVKDIAVKYDYPVKCRFSFDFSDETISSFETAATIVPTMSTDSLQYDGQVSVLCRTPDVRATYATLTPSLDYDDHVDAYL